ncbi:hypothetical protein [Nocardioides bruguierae]|uniref:Uncharacterized protein n=1 Tax=Nocardioides bruguierae TaxID=2945102 RepID=A0A9X2IH16_9ACTN|nr:hypothetical protein [Nocardioides bruguierae]MCM0622598.1 hypothetical protein [Nocardioides bruguierae]
MNVDMLTAAGLGAVYVSRPTGVAHVYVGPLTPGGHVPRARRAYCRAHTRRLTVIQTGRLASTGPVSGHRVCARCVTCLSKGARQSTPTGPGPVASPDQARATTPVPATPASTSTSASAAEPFRPTRDQYAARYADLTYLDAWAQVIAAETLAELEHIAHVSLLVLGHRASEQRMAAALASARPGRPVRHEETRVAATLTELISMRRERFAGQPHAALWADLDAASLAATENRKAAAREIRKDKARREHDLGINRARTHTPLPPQTPDQGPRPGRRKTSTKTSTRTRNTSTRRSNP